jgi:hypothetical protein
MKLAPTPEMLNLIKNQIRAHALAYRIDVVPVGNITRQPGGRGFAGAYEWPIDEALGIFERDGAIKVESGGIRILNATYFDFDFNSLTLPVRFTIDEQIRANVTRMAGLYVQLYDVENRLRYFLTQKLVTKHGQAFIEKLPSAVRRHIDAEKDRTKPYVIDTRNQELEYSQFSDLRKIIELEPTFISNDRLRGDMLGGDWI